MSIGGATAFGAGLAHGGGAKINYIPQSISNTGKFAMYIDENVGIGADEINQSSYFGIDENVGIGADEINQSAFMGVDENVGIEQVTTDGARIGVDEYVVNRPNGSGTEITPTIN